MLSRTRSILPFVLAAQVPPLQEKAYLCARVPHPFRRGDKFLDVGIYSAPAALLTVMGNFRYVDLASETGPNYHEAARNMLARMERTPRFRALLHYPGMARQFADMRELDHGAPVLVASQRPGVEE